MLSFLRRLNNPFESWKAGPDKRLLKFWRKDSREKLEHLEMSLVEMGDDLDYVVVSDLPGFWSYSKDNLSGRKDHYAIFEGDARSIHDIYQDCFIFRGRNHPDYEKIIARISRIFREIYKIESLRKRGSH